MRKLILSFLLLSVNANAIVVLKTFDAKETSLLTSGLESALQAYKSYYKTTDLKHFWFEYANEITGDAGQVIYQIKGEPDAALAEIKKIFDIRTENFDSKVIHEFDRLNQDLKNRGFVASRNHPWVPHKKLSVQVDKANIGPRKSDDGYFHNMIFEYELSYQKPNQVLDDGEEYPQIILRGNLTYKCSKEYSGCGVLNTWFDEAVIKWEMIPGSRGGRSSSGGG